MEDEILCPFCSHELDSGALRCYHCHQPLTRRLTYSTPEIGKKAHLKISGVYWLFIRAASDVVESIRGIPRQGIEFHQGGTIIGEHNLHAMVVVIDDRQRINSLVVEFKTFPGVAEARIAEMLG